MLPRGLILVWDGSRVYLLKREVREIERVLVMLEVLKEFERDIYDEEERKKFWKYWKKVVDKSLKGRYKEVVELVRKWKEENREYVVEVILEKILSEKDEEDE